MKRSLLDPLPRQLSTSALAALVALVVCGTGVAVARFLESGPVPLQRAPVSVRAAAPTSGDATSPRPIRAPSRGASYSISATPSASDGACRAQANSAPCQTRDVEPTLARPSVEGT